MKYELYDIAEIRAAAKERMKDTDGECKLFVKEWLDSEISDNPTNI